MHALCRFPNGCAERRDSETVRWSAKSLPEEARKDWVMWHAACIKGLPQKLSSLKGLLTLVRSGIDTDTTLGY